MSPDRERTVARGDKEDQLSDLPRNVIDHILELLPPKDAARTSILSRNWRHTWAMLPYLKLDYQICADEVEERQLVFKQTVYEILLQHVGDIVKFELSGVSKTPRRDIDNWILYVTRNGVKELTLHMYNIGTYKLPSYVFNCQTLTRLHLYNCLFKPPNSSVCFPKLTTLRLEDIIFAPTTEFYVINAPLLVSLDMIHCDDTEFLRIVSPRLESVDLHLTHYLLLNCFMKCRNVRVFKITYDLQGDISKHSKRRLMEKLLFGLAPTLERLNLDSVFIELFRADTFPKGDPCTFNSLWDLSFNVDFGKVSEASGALQLIKRCPNLSKLEINVHEPGDNYLDASAFLDRSVNKLIYVVINLLDGSTAELLFLKLLFACAPSLLRVSIKIQKAFGSTEEKEIIAEVMRIPRASLKAEFFYLPEDPWEKKVQLC